MLLALVLACAHPAPPAAPVAPDAPPPSPEAAPALAPPAETVPLEKLGGLDALVSPHDPSMGPADARFVLVEFSDFQCPYCAGFFPGIVNLAGANPDVRVVFKDYPLNSACNAAVGGQRHVFACDAAVAAGCAHAQEGFLAMATLLFANPDNHTRNELAVMAKLSGLDGAAFAACMDDPKAREDVIADTRAGQAAGVEGTPSVFAWGVAPGVWTKMPPQVEEIAAVLAQARMVESGPGGPR